MIVKIIYLVKVSFIVKKTDIQMVWINKEENDRCYDFLQYSSKFILSPATFLFTEMNQICSTAIIKTSQNKF